MVEWGRKDECGDEERMCAWGEREREILITENFGSHILELNVFTLVCK